MKWFERYYWFVSSNGLIVAGGKSKRNNQTIVKRYTKPHDLILNADVEAPIVVIKNDQKIFPLPAETIYEAAELVAAYSAAWNEKKESIPVFYILPEQISVDLIIQGEKKYLEKIKPRLSIGIKQEDVWNAKLIFGPPTAVKKQTPYMITLVPGDRSADDIVNEIRKELLLKIPYEIKQATEGIELKEIKKIIPFKKAELVR